MCSLCESDPRLCVFSVTCDIDWAFVRVVLSSYTACDAFCRIPPRRVVTTTDSEGATATNGGLSDAPPTAQEDQSVKLPPDPKRRSQKWQLLGNRSKKLILDPLLLQQPGTFEFRDQDFLNAVVMPGYRNLDQPQYYYVAEIRYVFPPRLFVERRRSF